MKYRVLECVVLIKDMPEVGLCKGDLGTIVEIYEPDGLEVEFVKASGDTQALVTLARAEVREVTPEDIIAVRQCGVPA